MHIENLMLFWNITICGIFTFHYIISILSSIKSQIRGNIKSFAIILQDRIEKGIEYISNLLFILYVYFCFLFFFIFISFSLLNGANFIVHLNNFNVTAVPVSWNVEYFFFFLFYLNQYSIRDVESLIKELHFIVFEKEKDVFRSSHFEKQKEEKSAPI